MQSFILVGIGGAIGAMARFGAGKLIGHVWPASFPLATLLINILGSTLMGVLVGLLARLTPSWSETARLFAAVGVLGGFTTFSAFSLETVMLIERGDMLWAGAYVLLSVVVCLAGLYLGLLVTRGLV
jgi:CrcB protein